MNENVVNHIIEKINAAQIATNRGNIYFLTNKLFERNKKLASILGKDTKKAQFEFLEETMILFADNIQDESFYVNRKFWEQLMEMNNLTNDEVEEIFKYILKENGREHYSLYSQSYYTDISDYRVSDFRVLERGVETGEKNFNSETC